MRNAPSIDDGLSLSRMETGRSDRSSIPSRNFFWFLRVIFKVALIVLLSFLMFVTFFISIMVHDSGKWSIDVVVGTLVCSIIMLLEVLSGLYLFKSFMYEFGNFIVLF
jgi:hypothetical protein